MIIICNELVKGPLNEMTSGRKQENILKVIKMSLEKVLFIGKLCGKDV